VGYALLGKTHPGCLRDRCGSGSHPSNGGDFQRAKKERQSKLGGRDFREEIGVEPTRGSRCLDFGVEYGWHEDRPRRFSISGYPLALNLGESKKDTEL